MSPPSPALAGTYSHSAADRELFEGAPVRAEDVSVLRRTFQSLYHAPDYRKARAQTLIDSQDAWLNVKTMLNRGEFNEASQWLQVLQAHPRLDPEAQGEALLEEARLHCYEGRWNLAIHRTTTALALAISGTCRLTLLQIRSVALFEMGRFSEAAADLDSYDTLVSVFPGAPTRLYSDILKLRILARTLSWKRARGDLDDLWLHLKKSEVCTWDDLLALSRAEIDLSRLAGESCFHWANLSQLASDSLGDGLYSHLAAFDLLISAYGIARIDEIENSLASRGGLSFERIRRMLDELKPQAPEVSLTVRTILSSPWAASEGRALCRTPEAIFFTRPRFVLKTSPLLMMTGTSKDQIWKAVEALRDGPIEKSEFFRRVWGRRTFTPHLHDANVRNLVHRLRSHAGIEVRSEQGMIEIPNGWVIG